MIFDLDQFTGPLDGGAGSEQGQEPSQVAAASLQAGDIGDLIREGKLLEVHLQQLPAGAPYLYRYRQPCPAQAYAVAGGFSTSGLQQMGRQEQLGV